MLTHFIQGVPVVGSSRLVLMKAAGKDLHASYNATVSVPCVLAQDVTF